MQRLRLSPLAVQIAGLAGTAWVIWITTFSPRLRHFTWSKLIGDALSYVLLAWLWSAVITYALYLAVPSDERRDVLWVSIRTASAAVWFAPAIFLMTQMSPAGLAATFVLVITATRLLYGEWRAAHPAEESPPAPAGGLFGDHMPPPTFLSQLAPALWIAATVQAGITAALWRLPLLAAALLAAGASMTTIFAVSRGAIETRAPRKLPRAALGVVLTLILASGLTVGGLSHRIRHRAVAGDYDSTGSDPSAGLIEGARAALRSLMYGEERPGDPPAAKPSVPDLDAGGPAPPGGFPGVILESETRAVPLLVAPVPANRALFGSAARSFSIPFDGQYWMYRWLYRLPPINSVHRKGSPANISFSTLDHWPLMMEAHQKFDQPIDLRCCRAVRVEIRNADRDTAGLVLELTAINGEGPVRPTLLGRAAVQSKPDTSKPTAAAVPETLEFAIPGEITDNCSELKLVFRRDGPQKYRSARVAIDRFVLVPR